MTRELRAKAVLLAVAFVAMAWGFKSLLLNHAPSVFSDPKEDMSFAWYVPLFSLYVLWVERGRLFGSLGRPSWAGALATLPFLFLGFLGVRGIQVRLEMVAFAGLLLALPWAFFGRKTAGRLVFPAGFLLFCVPLSSFLDVVTVHLRLFATGTAYAVLKGVGAHVVRTGTMLAASDGSFSIDIAEPCSGLRSIFALMALTAGYAYHTQPTWFRRAALFACSVPLAVFGNVMRILSICLVGSYASPEFATGFYHDYSGFVVFAAALSLMVVCGKVVDWAGATLKKGCEDGAQPTEVPAGASSTDGRLWLCVAVVIPLLACMYMQANTPDAVVCEAPEIRLGEMDGYTSEAAEPSEAELTILPADTRLDKRLYTAPGGDWFAVTAVIGGKSKSSIHRPELCLPAQGFLMAEPRTVKAGGAEWRVIGLDGGQGGGRASLAYTFFNQAGYRTASHIRRILCDVWDRSVHNRIDRWVMVTVYSTRTDDAGIVGFLERLKGAMK